jgi:hypothetical protein
MKKILFTLTLLTSLNTYSQIRMSGDRSTKDGIALTIGGVALTTSAILEGNANYGTFQSTQINPTTQSQKYIVPPFFRQAPRCIMFTVGVCFTITGLLTLKR